MAINRLNTKLDAVNLCLAGIGREPVNSLDTPDLDAEMAGAAIDRMSVEIQSNGGEGWWFNREKNWKLTPHPSTGLIKVPNNTLSLYEATCIYGDVGNRLTIRGDSVYDTDDHTLDLRGIAGRDGSVTFTLVMLLDYENLPQTARSAIAWTARRIFADDTEGDPNQTNMQRREEDRTMIALKGEEMRQKRLNYFSNTGIGRNILRTRGRYSRD